MGDSSTESTQVPIPGGFPAAGRLGGASLTTPEGASKKKSTLLRDWRLLTGAECPTPSPQAPESTTAKIPPEGLAVAAEAGRGGLDAHRPPPDAARTSIMMDARTDSGSPDQAAWTRARSGSEGSASGSTRVAFWVARWGCFGMLADAS